MLKQIMTFFVLMASVVITAAQIPTDSLVIYYPFSGNANDMSGNGKNGVVNGAALCVDRFGNSNTAYSFDGINGYITSTIGAQTTLSLSIWMNSDSSTQWYPNIFTIDGVQLLGQLGNHPYYISDGRFGSIGIDGRIAPNLIKKPSPPFKTWHHIVVVWNVLVNKSFLYIDGQVLDSAIATTSVSIGTGKILIGNTENGRAGDGGAGFKGKLDDIRLYKRLLTGSEISALFNEAGTIQINKTGFTGTPASFSVDTTFNTITASFNTAIFSSLDTLFLCYEIANLTYLSQRADKPANYSVNVGGAVADFGNNISSGSFSTKAINITALKALSANFQITFNYTGGGGEILFANPYLLVYGIKPITGAVQKSVLRPQSLMKASAFPNPVRTSATIIYSVPSVSPLDISIYNSDGKLVRNVFSGLRQAGTFSYIWDGTNLSGESVANGSYYFRAKAANGQQVLEKVVVLK